APGSHPGRPLHGERLGGGRAGRGGGGRDRPRPGRVRLPARRARGRADRGRRAPRLPARIPDRARRRDPQRGPRADARRRLSDHLRRGQHDPGRGQRRPLRARAPGLNTPVPDDARLFFANLTSPEIGELLASGRKTVLLFPVGSTEPHGPHSPLCTDPIISHGICVRVARRLADDPALRALVLPALSYAPTRYTGAFPGAVHVAEETLLAMV